MAVPFAFGQEEASPKDRKGEIHSLVPKVAADIGPVSRSQKNVQQGYNYRGIEAVMNALNPALVKHGVFIVPRVLDSKRETRDTRSGGTMMYTIMTVEYSFVGPDGSSVRAVVVGEGSDSGDKSSNKAMTAAFKYAVGQVFSIPFDLVDSEDDAHSHAPRPAFPPAPPPPPPPKPPQEEQRSHGEILALALEYIKGCDDEGKLFECKVRARDRGLPRECMDKVEEAWSKRLLEIRPKAVPAPPQSPVSSVSDENILV